MARVSVLSVVNVLPHILSMPSAVKVVACVVAIVPDAYPPGIYKKSSHSHQELFLKLNTKSTYH